MRWRCGHFLAGSVRTPIEQAWPRLRPRKICNGTGNGFQKIGAAQVLSHPSCCFGCVWCSSPPQGSSVISRKRNLPPYAPATRRAWSPAARYGTGTKLCCVDVGAAPLRRHGTVVTVVVLGTAVVSRAAVARAAVAAGVIVVNHSSNVAPVASRNCRHRRRSGNGSCVTRCRRRRCYCGRSLVWCHSNHRNHDTLVLATRKSVATGGQGPVGLLPIVHCEKYTTEVETAESGFHHGERSYLYSWDTQTPEDKSSRQMSEHRLSSVSVPGRSMCLPCTDYAISRLMNIM